MVTTYPETKARGIEASPETSQHDDLCSAWGLAYRQHHPEADWWAADFGAGEHSEETQMRVFRMAEQLVARDINRITIFGALRRADAVAQEDGGWFREAGPRPRHLYLQGRTVRSDDYVREPWCSSLPAAAAGCEVIDTLLGEHGLVVSLLPPEAFEEKLGRAGQRWLPRPQAGRVIILIEREPRLELLRANGFDPITFDGADPAAYAWVMFELASRTAAAATQLRCDCHRTFRPIPLGVAVDGSSRRRVNPRLLTLGTPVKAYSSLGNQNQVSVRRH